MSWIIRLSIFVVIAIIIIYLFDTYYNIQNKISYNLKFTTVSGNISKLIGYLGGNESQLDISYNLDLTNNSKGQITFSDLILELYYEGVLVAFTPSDKDNIKTTVLGSVDSGRNRITYKGTVKVLVNASAINLGLAIGAKKEVNIDYKVKVKATIFKIPITYTNTYIYKG